MLELLAQPGAELGDALQAEALASSSSASAGRWRWALWMVTATSACLPAAAVGVKDGGRVVLKRSWPATR
jgi:hypothetical protein